MSDDAQASAVLDPWEYYAWIRSIERRLLGGGDSAALESDLRHALASMAQHLALRADDWHIYLSLAWRLARSTGDVPALTALHIQSTNNVLDMRLFVRSASLLVSLFWAAHGSDIPGIVPAPDQLAAWTSLEGPELSADGLYSKSAIDSLNAPHEASEAATRDALRELYGRCAWHPESSRVWDIYMRFERGLLDEDRSPERIKLVHDAYVARLGVPNAHLSETFEQFSSFVSAFLAADEYEGVMSAANKHYAAAQRLWEEREPFEDRLRQATYDDWTRYLAWQGRQIKSTRTARDKTALSSLEELGTTLYRRALYALGEYPRSHSAQDDIPLDTPPTPEHERDLKQRRVRKSAKMHARDAANERIQLRERLAPIEGLWLDYYALVDAPKAEPAVILGVSRAAVRGLPSSGRLWATYIRSLVRFQHSPAEVDAVYHLAANGGVVDKVGGATSYAALLQAGIDALRASETHQVAMEAGVQPSEVSLVVDIDRFMKIYEALVSALAAAAQLSERDPSLMLERQTVDWVERAARALQAAGPDAAAGLLPLADAVWDDALQQQPDNSAAHLEAALYWKRRDDDKRARQIFRTAAARQSLEDRAPILDAWVQFEHERGSIADIQHAETRARIERERIWRAWYSKYQASVQSAAVQGVEAEAEAEAVQDTEKADTRDSKRKLESEGEAETDEAPKRARVGGEEPARDREYSAVIASGLPSDASADEVRAFFRECGVIFDVNGPRHVAELTDDGERTSAALVEFTERDAAAAALTRTLKRIRGFEVHVALSFQCTLYVTNFPPDADDAALRARFEKYGALFDVRWPSRRFMQSRRFCYVQFVHPRAAEAALQEHGSHWHGDHPLQVFLSNPMHKKVRSDADANARELFVSGLPRSTSAEDVRAFFETHAPVLNVRLPERPDGKSRGIAFIDFGSALDARRAMQATNSTMFKGRLIAVVLADAGKSRGAPPAADPEWRSRSVRVSGLPADAQEALIQQAVEKAIGAGTVRRIFWTPGAEGIRDALVELSDPGIAGRAVLAADAKYGEHPLVFSEYAAVQRAPRAPRGRGRGRGAFGHTRTHTSSAADTQPKTQDQFRAMLK